MRSCWGPMARFPIWDYRGQQLPLVLGGSGIKRAQPGPAWSQQRASRISRCSDLAVQDALKNHTQIVLTLGQSPTWASARPTEPSFYGVGAPAEPKDVNDWINHLQTVATRYRGKIFNSDLITALELGSLVELAETVVAGALARQESGKQSDEVKTRLDEIIRLLEAAGGR